MSLSDFDKENIITAFEKSSEYKTIKKLSRKYQLDSGIIFRILRNDYRTVNKATELSEAGQETKIDANKEAKIRKREKAQDKRWEKSTSKEYGLIPNHNITLTNFTLIPIGKNLLRNDGTETEKNWEKVHDMVKHLARSRDIYLTKNVQYNAHDSKWISEFAKKNNYPVKLLDTCSRAEFPASFSSPLRKINFNNIPVDVQTCGKSKKGGYTSGIGKIEKNENQYYLKVGIRSEFPLYFEIYIKEDATKEEDEYYKQILQRLENEEAMQIKIIDLRKKGLGFKGIVAGKKEEKEFNYTGKCWIIVQPIIENMRGYYKIFFLNEKGEQIRKHTYNFPYMKIKELSAEEKSGKIRAFIAKAINQIYLTTKELGYGGLLQPCVIYLNKASDNYNRDLENWLSEGKMFGKLHDKISSINGEIYKYPNLKMTNEQIFQPQNLNISLFI